MIEAPCVSRDVCIALNNLSGVTNPSDAPPVMLFNIGYSLWVGNNPNGTWWAATFAETRPVLVGCVEGLGASAGVYRAFAVLAVR